MKCVLGRFFNIISRLTQNEYTDNILMKVWITAGIWAQKSRARSDGTVWHGKKKNTERSQCSCKRNGAEQDATRRYEASRLA